MKHGEAQVDSVAHLSGEVLVPNRVEGLGLGGGPVQVILVDVHHNVGVDRLVLRLAEGHVGAVPLLEVGRPQAARFADLEAHCAGEHNRARGRVALSHLFSLVGCCHFALITTPRPTTKATTVLAVASQTWLSAEGDNPWLANSGAVLLRRRPISSTCSCDASGSRQVRHSNGADTLLSQGRRPESHGGKSLPPAFHTDEADNVYSAFYSGRVLNSMFDSDCGAPAAALPAVRCRCCPSCWCALCCPSHQSRVGAG